MFLTRSEPSPFEPSAQDQRTSLRVPITVTRVSENGEPTTFFGYAKNISRSGMLIGATNPKEPGGQYDLVFQLPQPIDRMVRCQCKVVWSRRWSKNGCHKPGMGLRFLDLPEDTARALDDWVNHQTREDALRS